MEEKQSSYRQIVKATSLFGGVQVFQIIIQIVRSKFIALLLGPAGMGIAGLLNSTIAFIGGITGFGLHVSAVRNVAEAETSGDNIKISTTVIVLRRLVWITGLLGAVLTLFMARWLSILTFGNTDYTWSFVWISISLLLSQINKGQLVILQGLRKLKMLAKANLTGSIFGLLITIPLYYVMGVEGIVPAIIINSIIVLLASWYYSRKTEIANVRVSKVRTIAVGKSMLIMGFMITLSGLIGTGASYILRIFISNTGGITDVGLYSAGFAIINSYFGLIFTAMGADFYPRLTSVVKDPKESFHLINNQAEIALLIMSPILLIFIAFINVAIVLLYSTKFIPINTMLYWAALGMFFKAASWPVGFILLAKGDSKTFFWSELMANTYLLGLNILGYYLYGLEGLGISFLLSFMLVLLQVYLIARIKYGFAFNKPFIRIFLIHIFLATLCVAIVFFFSGATAYLLGSVTVLCSVYFSYRDINKRINLKEIISNFMTKLRKKS